MTSLRARCTGIAKAVRAAVAGNSSCSPASLTEFSPDQEMSFGHEMLKVSRILAVEARALIRDGRPLEAAQLLTDGIRLGDDLSRGRVSMLVELIGQAMTRNV